MEDEFFAVGRHSCSRLGISYDDATRRLGTQAKLFWGVPILHAIAVYRFSMNERLHLDLALKYVRKAEKLLACEIQPEDYPRPNLMWWLLIEVVPTIILSWTAVKLAG